MRFGLAGSYLLAFVWIACVSEVGFACPDFLSHGSWAEFGLAGSYFACFYMDGVRFRNSGHLLASSFINYKA
jgi:hypothetical protein